MGVPRQEALDPAEILFGHSLWLLWFQWASVAHRFKYIFLAREAELPREFQCGLKHVGGKSEQ